MDFYQKYELLDLLKDEGVKVFNARERATGRQIAIFLFVGEQASLHAELLQQLRAAQRPERADLLEVGENQGTPFVATEPLNGLAELKRKVAAPPAPPAAPGAGKPPDAFTRVGVWHIPAPNLSGGRGPGAGGGQGPGAGGQGPGAGGQGPGAGGQGPGAGGQGPGAGGQGPGAGGQGPGAGGRGSGEPLALGPPMGTAPRTTPWSTCPNAEEPDQGVRSGWGVRPTFGCGHAAWWGRRYRLPHRAIANRGA